MSSCIVPGCRGTGTWCVAHVCPPETAETIADLINTIEAAIRAGDWKVDGACDPDEVLQRTEKVLRHFGWERVDGIADREWVLDE